LGLNRVPQVTIKTQWGLSREPGVTLETRRGLNRVPRAPHEHKEGLNRLPPEPGEHQLGLDRRRVVSRAMLPRPSSPRPIGLRFLLSFRHGKPGYVASREVPSIRYDGNPSGATHRRGYLALRARAPTSMSHGATTRASRVRYEAYIPSPRLLGTPRDWLRQCSRNARPSCDGSFASRFLLAQRFEMRPAKHGVRRHRPHASIRKCQARGVAAARLHSGGSHLAADNRDSSGLRPLWDDSRHGSARRCRARGNKATRHLPRGWLHRADWPGC